MKRILTAAVLSLFVSAPAFAGTCPLMVEEIDVALVAMPDLSAEQTAEVTILRNEGDALHQAGQHQESVEALQKAKDILGLE